MKLNITSRLSYVLERPTDLLLQVELARIAGQTVLSDALSTTPVRDFARIPAEGALGTRAWMEAEGQLDVTYEAQVEVTRPDIDLTALGTTSVRYLGAEATSYLMPSRYVPSDEFEALVTDEYSGLSGGALIVAVSDWIRESFVYDGEASTNTTTARDSYFARRGVCRDYAHVLIAFARASGIPARIASVYAPDVDPPDFHAVAEVWLEGAWHLVDATGMAKPSQMAVIGAGRDAAEVSFLSSFGFAEFLYQSVDVSRA